MLLFLYFLSTKCFFCFFSQYFFRSDGVFSAVRGCGLTWFLPLIILSVCVSACVRVCVWTCLCIVCSSFKMHIHTLVHACILPKLTRPVCHTPNHDYKLKCEELFCFCFVLYMYIDFLYGFPQDVGTPEYFLCPATDWDFTHCQEVLLCMKGDLNKHKLNQWFVPDCFMFSIWHLSKLLFMWGTFIVRDCLCVWAIIFNVCHSQRDGTVLHMLCNQTQSWSGIV